MANPKDQSSFERLDRKAKTGDAVSVVFFGGSLTWGANASDPQRTSYRGLMMEYLQKKYPKAAFVFNDAAIGGTGSDLGLFRLERDVLPYNPDLVFLDFTANDNVFGEDIEALACYESLLSRMIGEGIVVVQALFGFRWQFGKDYDLQKCTRRRDHLKIAKAYNTGVGDLYPMLQKKIASKKLTLKQLWPIDDAHPDDAGYAEFFKAVKSGFEAAIKDKRVCAVPAKPIFSDRFMEQKRVILVDRKLPTGWKKQTTYRTSLWFDGLPSRWMGQVAMCEVKDAQKIKSLKMNFEGSLVGVFGEADEKGLSFKVKIDGEVVKFMSGDKKAEAFSFNTSNFGPKGNLFMWRCIAKDLDLGKHSIEIIPVIPRGVKDGQLRIESICVAGVGAKKIN